MPAAQRGASLSLQLGLGVNALRFGNVVFAIGRRPRRIGPEYVVGADLYERCPDAITLARQVRYGVRINCPTEFRVGFGLVYLRERGTIDDSMRTVVGEDAANLTPVGHVKRRSVGPDRSWAEFATHGPPQKPVAAGDYDFAHCSLLRHVF
jgi:hypothetical protein